MKKPDIDIGACTLCMGCVEVCPEVFRQNDSGYIEVIDLQKYSEKDIDDAIMFCPEDCISWLDS
ncbi:MAG: ferredoxin [Desulfobacterales bacterium]|nr:ferredoxin [Desulfobacterales bacterium]